MRYESALAATLLASIFAYGCGDDDAPGDPVDAAPMVDAEPTVDAGADAAVEPGVDELYQAAVDDAEVVEASEIYDGLVAINDENMDLVRDDQDRVLVATWTSFEGYDGEVGNDSYTLAVEVWVTVVPEVQEFCRDSGLQGDDLSLRLEQLLGLPPEDGKNRVVQLWVPPEALFRPSPDPEVDDSVAELDFPQNTAQAHIDWIENLRMSSYGDGGYPWTQLGYTYDWNPDTPEIGLSEFVITQGSTVGVESVTMNDAYCQPE
ncbi:hypothetical protein [Haliangium ochraceum]|uniref:Lipoprotein n=1 Tax=Haliangium ochraceum (strain DSM 14365 / JCM 11303 / SMP-2) TaxID=502025 RepID=D0LYP4_HALO1|nr:hypothetical protein [Haliangium ochraceum]ACY17910.1 conserved hypothetical protein [Haliangium ochraceum DSM 14365]